MSCNSMPNSPSILHQSPRSTYTLQNLKPSRKLDDEVHFSTLTPHQSNPPVIQSCMNKEVFSGEKRIHQQQQQHRSIPISPSVQNKPTSFYRFQQYQSNLSVFNSYQIYEQQFDNDKRSFHPRQFTQSTSQIQSVTNRNAYPGQALAFQEDIPINQNENYHIQSMNYAKTISAPKTLPESKIDAFRTVKHTNSVNYHYIKLK